MLPLGMLQTLLADRPRAVLGWQAYPQLLEELLKHAAPSASASQAAAGSREAAGAAQQAAARCIALLAPHEERAFHALTDQVLPDALASSSSVCWHILLTECQRVLAARQALSASGDDKSVALSLQRVIAAMQDRQGTGQCRSAEGPAVQARRLCRLALSQVSPHSMPLSGVML